LPEQHGEEFVETLVEFARLLRDEDVQVGPGDVVTYCAAVAELEPSDLLDVYWAGRSTLVSRHEQIPVYDRVFRRFFLGYDEDAGPSRPFSVRTRAEATSVLQVPETEPGPGEEKEEREAELGLVASSAATLKGRRSGRAAPTNWPRCAGSCGRYGSPHRGGAAGAPSPTPGATSLTCVAPCASRCGCWTSRLVCRGAADGCGCAP
jgi:hypothetical protein